MQYHHNSTLIDKKTVNRINLFEEKIDLTWIFLTVNSSDYIRPMKKMFWNRYSIAKKKKTKKIFDVYQVANLLDVFSSTKDREMWFDIWLHHMHNMVVAVETSLLAYLNLNPLAIFFSFRFINTNHVSSSFCPCVTLYLDDHIGLNKPDVLLIFPRNVLA